MKILTFIISLLISSGAYALSLEQCKELALKHDRDLTNKRLDIELSDQTSKEAFTHYFPSVQAGGLWATSRKPLMEFPMFNPITSSLMPISLLKEGKAANLTLTQPIFVGGQILNSNKLARLGKETSRLQLELSSDDVEEKCEQYFWQQVQLQQNLVTVQSMEQMLNSVKHDVEIAIKAGMTTRNDLLRVQMQQQELISAKLKLNNGIHTTQLLLRQLTGIEDSISTDYENLDQCAAPLTLWVDPVTAAQLRPEAQLLEKKVQASEIKKKIELGKLLPTAAIGAGLMYHDLMGKNFNTALFSVNLSVPITDWWGGSHALKKKKIEIEQAENQRLDAVEMLTIKIQRSFSDLEEAYQQIQVQQQAVDSAGENMRINRQAYKTGNITMSDLLDAQNLLIQNHYNLTQAQINYQLSIGQYLRMVH